MGKKLMLNYNKKADKPIEVTSILPPFENTSNWYIDDTSQCTITTMIGNDIDMVVAGGPGIAYCYFDALTIGTEYIITWSYADPEGSFVFYDGNWENTTRYYVSDATDNKITFTATASLAILTLDSVAESLPFTVKYTDLVLCKSSDYYGG